jgi:hypothetical protein
VIDLGPSAVSAWREASRGHALRATFELSSPAGPFLTLGPTDFYVEDTRTVVAGDEQYVELAIRFVAPPAVAWHAPPAPSGSAGSLSIAGGEPTPIFGYGWSMSNRGAFLGAGGGDPEFGDVAVTKGVDASSVDLIAAIRAPASLPRVVVGTPARPTLTLTDARVTSWQLSASGRAGEGAREHVAFDYQRIAYGPAWCWSVSTNTSCS